MDGWTDGQTGARIDHRAGKQMGGWMAEEMGGWTDAWNHRAM